MNKNDFQQNRLVQAVACVLAIGSVAWAYNSDAATGTATATATVVEAVSISIIVPNPDAVVSKEVVTTPALSGILFTIERFTDSLSPGGPLLRIGSPPAIDAEGAFNVLLQRLPPAAGSATVTVTINDDGSLSVSGGSNLMFALAQPVDGTVIIELN